MGRFLLALTVLLVLVTAAFALKCYECGGTEDSCSKSKLQSDSSSEKDCPSGSDKCIRTWLHKDDTTTVSNDCTNQLGCDLAQTACDSLDGDVDCKVGCCSDDLCNAGSPLSFSIFLITVCSFLGLALLM